MGQGGIAGEAGGLSGLYGSLCSEKENMLPDDCPEVVYSYKLHGAIVPGWREISGEQGGCIGTPRGMSRPRQFLRRHASMPAVDSMHPAVSCRDSMASTGSDPSSCAAGDRSTASPPATRQERDQLRAQYVDGETGLTEPEPSPGSPPAAGSRQMTAGLAESSEDSPAISSAKGEPSQDYAESYGTSPPGSPLGEQQLRAAVQLADAPRDDRGGLGKHGLPLIPIVEEARRGLPAAPSWPHQYWHGSSSHRGGRRGLGRISENRTSSGRVGRSPRDSASNTPESSRPASRRSEEGNISDDEGAVD